MVYSLPRSLWTTGRVPVTSAVDHVEGADDELGGKSRLIRSGGRLRLHMAGAANASSGGVTPRIPRSGHHAGTRLGFTRRPRQRSSAWMRGTP